jgi:hypothetical protein
MSVLLRRAGLPRHALRLKASDDAHRTAVAEVLRGRLPESEVQTLAGRLIEEARRRLKTGPPRHRALADAQAELEVWREVRRLAEREAAGRNA